MEFTQEQVDRHNSLTEAASAMIENEMILNGGPNQRRPGFFKRRRLKRAIGFYQQALEINPMGWSSMWIIGKIFQRLGDQRTAYDWFTKAHRINPTQPDVAREAGLAAMDLGHTQAAVELCFAAVKLAPDDLGLQSNLALAYLLTGDYLRADECARVAVSGAPTDQISRVVLSFVRDVASGRKKRPATLSEVFPI